MEEADVKSQKQQTAGGRHHTVAEESERNWYSIFIIKHSLTSQAHAWPEKSLAQILPSAAQVEVSSESYLLHIYSR